MKNIFKFYFTIFLTLSSLFALAQPPNDACSGAFGVTPDGTCYGPGLPQTTTTGSGDSWIGTVGCAGNDNDVWFSFTATASQLNINVTAGTMTGDVEFVLVQATDTCTGFSLVGSSCGPSPLVDTLIGLQVGVLYYYTISSTGTNGTFTTCVENVAIAPLPGQDCPTAAVLCDSTTFSQGTSNAGYGNQEISTTNSCWGSGGERQSKWFKFTVGCAGTIEFNINPNVSGDDYDWALYDISGDPSACVGQLTTTNLQACNWSGCKGSTGISTCTDLTLEPGSNKSGSGCGGSYAAWASTVVNATAGQSFALLVDNFSTTNNGFTLTFGGACGGGTALIGPTADFTMTATGCGAFNFSKNCQTTNSTFLWNFGDGGTSTLQNPSYTYTTSGTYTISLDVTDALGCTKTTSQTVTVGIPTPPVVSGAGTYCENDVINLSATASLAGTLNWYSDAALTTLVNTGSTYTPTLTAGSYTYYVTEDAGGCVSSPSSISVTVNPTENASFSYSATGYCQNGSDPTPTITGVSGGTFTSTAGLVINASTGTIDVSASTAGGYTVTYTTSGTCFGTATFNLLIVVPDDPSFTYSAPSYCQDATDPTPTITGLAGGTFSSTAGLVISSGTGLIDVSASTPGNYVVTYTTNGTCPSSTTANVQIIAVDDPTFSYSSASYCQDATNPTPTISGTAGGTFTATAGLVINASSGTIDLLSSTVGGPYVVTYTTAGACPASSTFNVSVVAVENASFTYPSASYCQDATNPTPTITGVAGGTFSSAAGLAITPGSGAINLASSTPGTYTVTYTTSGTCPGTATFGITITAVDDPTFSYSTGTYCLTGTNPTPVITGTTGGIFTQTGGLVFAAADGTIDLTASGIGTYTVIYTTAGTCPATSSVSINITSSPDATFSYTGTPYCQGTGTATVTYGPGAGGGDFTWNGGAGLNLTTGAVDLNTATPGSYTVTNTIAAAGGCASAVATNTIDILPSDDATFSYSAASYCQDATNPTATLGGSATPGGTFTGSSGSITVNSADGTIDLLASTPGNYDITYTTNGTCPVSSIFNVTITPVQDASFSYSAANYCQSGSDPSPTITGASGGIFTTSSSNLVIASGTGIIDVSASTPGTYDVTYTTGGTCPGTSTVQVTITADDDPGFSYSVTSVCQDATTNPVPTVTGTPGGTFTSTAGLVFVSAGEIDLANSTAGSYDVTYTTSGLCPASSTFNITITPVDDPSFSYTSNSVCIADANPVPTISGTSGGAFTIDNGGTINSVTGEIDLSATGSGSFVVTYTTNGTCPSSSTYNLTITSQLDATITPAGPFCSYDASSVLTAATTGGVWSGIGVDPSASTFDPSVSGAGTFDVIYTLSGSCGNADTIQVIVNAAPTANAGSDITIISGESTTLTATGGGSYVWSPSTSLDCSNCQSPIASPTETTTYTVVVTNDSTSCVDTAMVNVIVELPSDNFFVPNIFSPNGDGNNDVFYVYGSGLNNFNLTIYNRWGEKIYESENQTEGWKGTQNGTELNSGVYVYAISYTDTDGNDQLVTGNVTLIK